MNYLKTIIALIALLALGYYASILDKQPPEESAETKKEDFVNFSFDKLTNIRIKRDYDTFAIEFAKKAGDEWFMQKPVDTLADQQVVNELINNIRTAKADSKIEEKEVSNYDDFGLGTKSVSLTLKADTEELLINYGSKNPNGSLGYSSVNGSKTVTLVESKLLNDSMKAVFDYRDKKLSGINPAAITSFEVSYPASKEVYLFKKDHDFWYAADEKKSRVNSEVVDEMLNKINSARAAAAIDENSDEYGEASVQNGTGEITLSFASANTAENGVKISIGRNHPLNQSNCFVKTNYKKELLLINKNIKQDLIKKAADFAPKKCLDIKANNVNEIKLIPGDTIAVELKKSGSEWKINRRGSAEVNIAADSAKVESLVQSLQQAPIEHIAEEPAPVDITSGFEKATYEVKLGLTFSGRTESVFLIPSKYDTAPYVRCDEKNRYYKVPKNTLDEIIKLGREIAAKEN